MTQRKTVYNTPTYRTWNHMLQRCLNPNNDRWKDYGGRGIKVCKRWLKFKYFLRDMKERPDNTSIDRIDNNGDYNLTNCKWSTRKEQMNNKKDNHYIIFNGVKKTLQQWAELIGIKKNTLCYRFKRGWSIERALTNKDDRCCKKNNMSQVLPHTAEGA